MEASGQSSNQEKQQNPTNNHPHTNGMETINQKRLKMSSKYETNKLRGKLQVLRRYEIRIHPQHIYVYAFSVRRLTDPIRTVPNNTK